MLIAVGKKKVFADMWQGETLIIFFLFDVTI